LEAGFCFAKPKCAVCLGAKRKAPPNQLAQLGLPLFSKASLRHARGPLRTYFHQLTLLLKG
jgi:hypothetical protein